MSARRVILYENGTGEWCAAVVNSTQVKRARQLIEKAGWKPLDVMNVVIGYTELEIGEQPPAEPGFERCRGCAPTCALMARCRQLAEAKVSGS